MVAKYNRTEGVYLGIWPLVGSNEIDVAQRLREEMDRIRPTLPKRHRHAVGVGRHHVHAERLGGNYQDARETILIVATVVFLFMGSVRTALVPLVAMPVSLVGGDLYVCVRLQSESIDDPSPSCCRWGWWWTMRSWSSRTSSGMSVKENQTAGGAARLPRVGRAHHCHDDYAGCRMPRSGFKAG